MKSGGDKLHLDPKYLWAMVFIEAIIVAYLFYNFLRS